MEITRTISDVREKINQLKRTNIERAGTSQHKQESDVTVGFVPTMGYLHEGHMSLMKRAKAECDIVVLSIFVNPLQFGENEDYDTYPRDEQHDLQVAEQMGVDIVFMPDVHEMYPAPLKTRISVQQLTDRLCGASRPGHFDGVATVVLKLFHIVAPDKAYFGLKDAQQVAVIQQMVDDLNLNTQIVPCPIVREDDGLAKSSRNVYLSPEERSQAVVLSQALRGLEQQIQSERQDMSIQEAMDVLRQMISEKPLAIIDYIDIVSFPALEPFDPTARIQSLLSSHTLLVALAVKFGKTRLIDNVILSQNKSSS